MRRRVDELEHLTELGEILARAETLDVLPAVASRSRKLLRAEACTLYCSTPPRRCCTCGRPCPKAPAHAAEIVLSELGPELARGGPARRPSPCRSLRTTSCSGSSPPPASEVDLARAVANQAAVALKKIELIERLTEKNLIKDFFEQLALAASRCPGSRDARRARVRPRPALCRARRFSAVG